MRRHLLFIAVIFAFLPALAHAADAIPLCTTLGDCINAFYTFAQGIIGLCVFVMLIYTGICYLFNNGKDFVSGQPAWKLARDAVAGLVLLFSAYVILNTINHDLVTQGGGLSLPQRGGGGTPIAPPGPFGNVQSGGSSTAPAESPNFGNVQSGGSSTAP